MLRGLLDYGYDFENNGFLRNAGAILSFKLFKLKVRDLCQFIKSSLARACKDYGLNVQKQDFNHSKMTGWDAVTTHRNEVIHYLNYDVLCLAELFKVFQNEMFNCFKQDINSCVSISQFGYKAWASTCGDISEIYIPHSGKEENDDRAAYYGGRVAAQRKEYQSNQFVEDCESYEYDKIDDYLVIGDVNSLYPHVQRKYKYAYGKWRYWSGDELALLNSELQERFAHIPDEEWMLRCCFRVNVECPKDLFTPFLVERTKEDRLVATLDKKVGCWYWGCEIIEALIIGYHVTEVIEVKEFEKREHLFETFVSSCWEGRKKNPKPNIKNSLYKLVMNSTTGKFGQKSHATETTLYNCRVQENANSKKDFDAKKEKIVDFDFVFDSNGSNCAMVLETFAENKDPTYPVYLSAQILAYSRVYMSTIYRYCNAYLDPTRAIYYTDTDSLVMPNACIPDLIKFNMIGKEMGQLGCDLYDPFIDNKFAKILRGIWAAPKGIHYLS